MIFQTSVIEILSYIIYIVEILLNRYWNVLKVEVSFEHFQNILKIQIGPSKLHVHFPNTSFFHVRQTLTF